MKLPKNWPFSLDKEREAKMIAAHKDGAQRAQDGDLHVEAELRANFTYADVHERTAFAAGYQGEIRRMAEKGFPPRMWRGTINGV